MKNSKSKSMIIISVAIVVCVLTLYRVTKFYFHNNQYNNINLADENGSTSKVVSNEVDSCAKRENGKCIECKKNYKLTSTGNCEATLTNPMKVTVNQSWKTNYSTSEQTNEFKGATNAQGDVTYFVASQLDSKEKEVTLFSIPNRYEAILKLNAKAPAGEYTVKIRAHAAGLNGYKKGDKYITMKVAIASSNIAVKSVSLNKTKLSLTVGSSATLTATVKPDDATNKNVTWSTSNKNVVTVSKGVIKGIKEGTATITVTTKDGSKKATCEVTVKKKTVAVKSVSLNKTNLSLTVGSGATLKATINPSNATNKNVTWSTSNKNVVTVSKGVIKGIKAGTATITVTTKDGSKKATCKVTVKGKNPIAVTAKQSLTVDYSTSALTKTFKGASKAQGKVTYSIKSQKDSSGEEVKYFGLSSNTKTDLKMAAKTPAEKYTVVITATAAGNSNYAKGSKDITLTITVNKKANTMTVKEKQNLTINYSTSAKTKSFAAAKKKQGTVTYSIKSQKNSSGKTVTYFKISNSKKTKITANAKTPSGTYTVVVNANAKGNANYNSITKTITLTIKIKPVAVTGVTIDKTLSLKVGKGATLKATVTPSDAANKNVTWKSSNTKIVTVSNTGVVKGIAAGTADITVTTKDGNKKATCKVTVTKASNPMSIEVEQKLSTTYNTIAQNISFKGATNAQGAVTYSIKSQKNSSGKAVKYFSITNYQKTNIKMNAKTPVGTYTVVVNANAKGNNTYNEANKEIKLIITVNTSNKVTETKIDNPMTVKTEQDLSVSYNSESYIKFAGATNAQGKLTYNIASQNCQINGKKCFTVGEQTSIKIEKGTPVGTYTVVVNVTDAGTNKYKAKTLAITLNITVKPVSVESIVLHTSYEIVDIGSEKGLKITTVPANAAESDLIWKSSDPKGVTVDENGTVKGLKAGHTALITVTTKDGSVKDNCEVEVQHKIVSTQKIVSKATTVSFEGVKETDKSLYYEIWSQKNSSGTKVKYFSIPNDKEPKLKIKKNTPPGVYNIEVDACYVLYGIDGEEYGETCVTTYIKLTVENHDITKDSKYNSYNIVASCESDTLNYKVIQYRDSANYEQNIALIWVKDAYKQMNTALANDKADGEGTTLREILTNEKAKYFNNSNGCMIGSNASFFNYHSKSGGGTTSTQSSNIIISKGKVYRNNGTEGLLGLTTSSKFKYYSGSARDDKPASTYDNAYGLEKIRNTMKISNVGSVSTEDGKIKVTISNESVYDPKTDNTKTTHICQLDENNYVLLVGYGGKQAMAEMYRVTGCSYIWILDGSESSQLYYQNHSGNITAIRSNGRRIVDALYFSEHLPSGNGVK